MEKWRTSGTDKSERGRRRSVWILFLPGDSDETDGEEKVVESGSTRNLHYVDPTPTPEDVD